MDINNLQPNSHKYKAEKSATTEEKKVEKVVTGKVTTKKKSEIRKLTDVFISEDIKNVKSYVLMDVLIPAIKKAVSDIVVNGIDMILYGETGHNKKSKTGYVSYRDYSSRRDERSERRTGSRFDYDDLEYETRGEAEAVRDGMYEILDRYAVVTVADMYDLSDMTAPYTANKYGWTSLRNADIIRTRDGYVIKLPKALAID